MDFYNAISPVKKYTKEKLSNSSQRPMSENKCNKTTKYNF